MREEETKRSSQDSSMKRFIKKRWVFPAIYIASAAIILTAVLWYQTSSNNAAKDKDYDYNATDIAGKKYNQPAIEVNSKLENIGWPVNDPATVVIQKEFYDADAKPEAQEAALISYNNSFRPNTGIDITMENGETFDVVAALSGTVTNIQEDTLLGNVITIEHDKNVVTQYSSVKDFAVEVGAQVKQGQAIAKAGQSLYNEEAGVHVHFEIRKDNKPVNPNAYFNKPVSTLQEEKPAEDKATDESKKEESADESDKAEEGAETDKNKDQDGETSEDPSKEKEESTDSTTNPS
ncbi:peptidoglycan DD-metalloendopeptidase family protein [Bacillus sp. CGMCC 1.16607]|uniref:peptidoglycan DD-metalloendopeptidase family protein n=1 Tax=Bacillus sp. CGMCC 1.16607 TaxID=3351842 RepID=UPI00362C0E6D